MNVVINLDILNKGLKPAHINLFLHLVRLSENNEVTITVSELMKAISCSNKKQVVDYLKSLKDTGVIFYESEHNKANTYKINTKYCFV